MSAGTDSVMLAELEKRYLELAYLVVTHWGYLRSDARESTSLSGLFFKDADALLNPIFGSAYEAHRIVLAARSEGPDRAVATPASGGEAGPGSEEGAA